MATYHLSVKFGGKGKALAHASYIMREDKFSDRKDLEHAEHGNMPEWAKDDPAHFWQAADEFERANGSTYREFEIALPRELNSEQRLELVRDFVRQEIGDKHAYSFAIHNPKASIDGGEQPHAHIMMSQRVSDGIERSPEHYFKRYNAKYPERGGARKDSGHNLTPTQQKQELKALRQRWEAKHNDHMQRHGHSQKIDSRSFKDRGIIRYPEQHFGFESAGRLTPEQKESIKSNRGLSSGAAIEQAKSIGYTDKNWIKAISLDVKQQQLVKSLTQDISQQHGRLMKASITPNGNVSIEKVKSRGISMGW
ncbi:MobA/MobL family protein [Salmonella enterica]|nr:mobilization protein [Salmonella enterica]EAW3956581.1 mobilization protein [Salmonella enterica subsp. enterica]EBV6531644.1 mobilization protein [Salmonella enterica subsp. enterica serovar Oranienburg]EDC0987235.1 mobilization protein [Salmonella enterica subsp. enterica serovar Give]EEK0870661.1 mobilization protein [Salmonella enterica subsp. enterica serovar Dublin]EEM2803245.1 mobilization protein [Salmonella enterica subsp. enterica serovar Rubislaw]